MVKEIPFGTNFYIFVTDCRWAAGQEKKGQSNSCPFRVVFFIIATFLPSKVVRHNIHKYPERI